MSRIALRSAIRGRERWEIDPLRSHPRYAGALERELSRHAPIRHAWANPVTGRLLLRYDTGVRPGEIRDRLHASLDVAPLSADELHDWRTSWPHGFDRSAAEIAVEQARIRLLLSAGLFSGVLAKRALLGVGMFAGSPVFVTTSAILTIISGYTAVRRAFHEVTGAFGLSGRTILTAAALTSLVIAESIDGLGAHVVAHWGELREAVAVRDYQHAIHSAGYEVLPPSKPHRDRYEAVSTAALLAAAGTYIATGDSDRAMAMLVGAVPVAGTEARTTARALALNHAIAHGIYFKEPQTVTSGGSPTFAFLASSSKEEICEADVILVDDDPDRVAYAEHLIARASRIVGEDMGASRLIGIAGFTAATLGKLSAANAAHLHNYTRLAMELNSLRLVRA